MLITSCGSFVNLYVYYNDSVVREVPDNQEVFTHPVTDQSIIFEVLEAVQDHDEEAVRYFSHKINFKKLHPLIKHRLKFAVIDRNFEKNQLEMIH